MASEVSSTSKSKMLNPTQKCWWGGGYSGGSYGPGDLGSGPGSLLSLFTAARGGCSSYHF